MARPKNITVYLKGKTWFGKFYDHEFKRRNKSFKTNSIQQARVLQRELELLSEDRYAKVSNQAYLLFFGKTRLNLSKRYQ